LGGSVSGYNRFWDCLRCDVESVKEQGICVEFYLKLGTAAAESRTVLRRGYVDDGLSQTTTCESYRRFENGRSSTDVVGLCDRPSA
jgi:hypothetical protein